ncbi:MAG: hypothetical protein KDK99_13145 [Verrucomicrobiales bacterium]|nr:hypothetical protein [Verrucomicrobiales bacterium]
MKTLLWLALIALSSASVRGDEDPWPKRLVVDLNGDGVREEIVARRTGSDTELGDFYQLQVRQQDGTVLWRSSDTMDPTDPLAFGNWDFGSSMPQWAGDIDGDGRVELIAPAPQSDVSATFYRVFRWTGQGFESLFSRALIGGGEPGAAFQWTENPPMNGFWVQEWVGASAEGGLVVRVVSYDGSSSVLQGLAVLMPSAGGYVLERWITWPAAMSGDVGDESGTDEGIVRYRARLSVPDHYSSAGVALTSVAEILQQDRANHYRGSTQDAEDEADPVFGDRDARMGLKLMQLNVMGGDEAAQRIVRGTPLVKVTVGEGEITVEVIHE